MNILNDVSLTRLDTAELRTLADGVVSALAPLAATDSHIRRNIDATVIAQKTMSVISAIPMGSTITGEIKQTDDEMDTHLRLTRSMLELNSSMAQYDAAKAQASAHLLAIITKRPKSLFDGNYKEQPVEVSDFLDEIMVPELMQARMISGVEPLLQTVRQKLVHLKELFAARGSEESAPSTVLDQKKILRYRLNALLTYTDSNLTDNVELFAPIAGKLNDLIGSVMATFRARETRKETAAEVAKAVQVS